MKGNMDEHSLLGWLSPKWLITILIFGLVIGVCCISGFNYAVRESPVLTYLPILIKLSV